MNLPSSTRRSNHFILSKQAQKRWRDALLRSPLAVAILWSLTVWMTAFFAGRYTAPRNGAVDTKVPPNVFRESLATGWDLREEAIHGQELRPSQEPGVAFFVQVSAGNWPLLSRVFDRIYHQNNIYILHFDKHMNESTFHSATNSVSTVLEKPNVVQLQREWVSWGGISVVLNILSAMATVQHEFHAPWTHFITVAPSNYPLLAPDDLRDILAQNAGRSYAHFESFTSYQTRGVRDLDHKMNAVHVDPAVYDLGSREGLKVPLSYPRNIGSLPWNALPHSDLVKGEAWMILSRQDVEYALHSGRAKRLLVQIAPIHAPDEWYFQNVVLDREMSRRKDSGLDQTPNSPRNDHMHFVLWNHARKENPTPNHPMLLDSPATFLPDVWSSGALFARKFHHNIEGCTKMMDLIDERILHNKEYVALAERRMSGACYASEINCRNTRWVRE